MKTYEVKLRLTIDEDAWNPEFPYKGKSWENMLNVDQSESFEVLEAKEVKPEPAIFTDSNGVSWRYVDGQLEYRYREGHSWGKPSTAAKDFLKIAKLISESQEHSVKQPFTVKYRTGLTVKELGRVLGVPSSVILNLLEKHAGVLLREEFTLTLSEFKTLGNLLHFGVDIQREPTLECPW